MLMALFVCIVHTTMRLDHQSTKNKTLRRTERERLRERAVEDREDEKGKLCHNLKIYFEFGF